MQRWVLTVLLLLFGSAALAEDAKDAADHRAEALKALRESQTNQKAIVTAAKHFAKAAAIYEKVGDADAAVEANSFLYWCKKKMTLADIEAFAKSGEVEVSKQLVKLDEVKVEKTDAQAWYDRAEKFATANPDEHLLIAIRFFEVADRFKDSDPGRSAMDRSLKEMQMIAVAPAKAEPEPAQPPAARPAPEVVAKAAVPEAAKLKEAEKTIKDIFKDEYAKRAVEEKKALAAKLLQQAIQTKDDPASRYVLLKESAANAVAAGDAETAMKALDELGKGYEVDVGALQLEALAKITPASSDAAKVLARMYLKAIDDAVTADSYDTAVRLSAAADTAARKAQDMPLVTQVTARGKEVRALQTDFAKVKTAQATLKEKPDDPEANLVVGKFVSFNKGDWANGLPLLAKSSDAKLKELAEKDLAAQNQAMAQIEAGDSWWDAGEKMTGSVKLALQGRAAECYRRAGAALTGLQRTKANTRVVALETAKGATPKIFKTEQEGMGIDLGGREFNVGPQFTLEFWFKTKAERGVLMSKRHQEGERSFSPRLHNGTLYFMADGSFYKAEAPSKKPVNDNQWHHLAMVKSGTDVVVYLDGKKQAQFATLEMLNSGSNWKLGFHGAWHNGNMLRNSLDCEYCCVRLSSIPRYKDEFVPTKTYVFDLDALLFK